MAQKKRKILFAAVDIGWRIEHYCKFIQERFPNELDADSFVKYYLPKKHYDTNYTYMYNFQEKSTFYGWFVSFYFFIVSLFKYDIFHFFSGETLLTRKLRRFEFFIYKLLGKKIILHFVGSDIRSPYYIDWKTTNINQYLKGELSEKETLGWQDRLIKDSTKFANHILVSTPDLLELIPTAIYYPVVIDIKKMKLDLNNKSKLKNKDEIVILHAPSNERLKGSEYIYQILQKVQKESDYNIILKTPRKSNSDETTYSVSRYGLFELYKEADIVIDQLIIGWYGLQAIEAILTRNQIISYIEYPLIKYLSPNCPIENANVNNLEEVVLRCINKHVRKEIDFEKNINWVKKYHTIEENNEKLIQAWLE